MPNFLSFLFAFLEEVPAGEGAYSSKLSLTVGLDTLSEGTQVFFKIDWFKVYCLEKIPVRRTPSVEWSLKHYTHNLLAQQYFLLNLFASTCFLFYCEMPLPHITLQW